MIVLLYNQSPTTTTTYSSASSYFPLLPPCPSFQIRLMAMNCTSSLTQIPIQKFGSFLKINKDFMYKPISVPLKKAPALRIRSSFKNKVYEDQSQGIICYTDESGEIICEGYDEGPRFQPISWPIYHPRDAEIMNLLLQQNWLQIVRGDETNHVVEGIYLKQDFNCNGSNSFC